MTVNKERVKLWVDALRSGNYRQTQGVLKDDEGYCCLGVGVEVALDNGLQVKIVDIDETAVYDHRDVRDFFYSAHNNFPEVVRDWFGFDRSSPELLKKSVEYPHGLDAIEANDDQKWDFAAIADAVEEMYLNDETSSV